MEHTLQTYPARPLTPAETDIRRRSDEVRQILDEAAALDVQLANEPTMRDAVAQRRAVLAANLLHVLQGWRRNGGDVRLGAPTEVVTRPPRPPVPVADGEEVRAHVKRILAGLAPSTDDATEIDRLHAAIRDSARWAHLPRELRRGVVALCTTRLRRLQDDRRFVSHRLEEAFAMLTAYSKREQPGFVVGLSRSHKPVRGDWGEDAAAWWERLSATVDPSIDPNAAAQKLIDAVARTAGEVEIAPPEARDAVLEQLRSAVRTALDGGVPAHDDRMLRLCLPFDEALDGPEFRGLRRALREPSDAAEAR
jgi:hypothetical protein